MNTINAIGYLGRDIAFYPGKKGKKAVAIANLAIDNGKDFDPTWIRVKTFGKAAEAAKDLAKGARVAISGRLQNNNYKGKDGEDVYSFEIVIPFFTFLSEKATQEDEEDSDDGDVTYDADGCPI